MVSRCFSFLILLSSHMMVQARRGSKRQTIGSKRRQLDDKDKISEPGNDACRKNITEGNDRADEVAQDGHVGWRRNGLEEGQRSSTERERKRERECSRGITYAASFHCLVEEWRECEELKPRTSTMATFFWAGGVWMGR